eukprot:scaffold7190_cov193-Amphora_coffeaeformis.AAC.9
MQQLIEQKHQEHSVDISFIKPPPVSCCCYCTPRMPGGKGSWRPTHPFSMERHPAQCLVDDDLFYPTA